MAISNVNPEHQSFSGAYEYIPTLKFRSDLVSNNSPGDDPNRIDGWAGSDPSESWTEAAAAGGQSNFGALEGSRHVSSTGTMSLRGFRNGLELASATTDSVDSTDVGANRELMSRNGREITDALAVHGADRLSHQISSQVHGYDVESARPFENVSGTSGADFIHVAGDGRVAPAGYNEITTATDGADVIDPGGGADIVYAGGGDDQLVINDVADISGLAEMLDGGDGDDSIAINGMGSLDLSKATLASIESVSIALRYVGDVTGSSQADQISVSTPDPSHQHVSGGAGDDFIRFGAYNEIDDDKVVLHGGDGNDIISVSGGGFDDWEGFSGFATIYGDGGDDDLSGADQFSETIYGGAGDDWISGGVKGWDDDVLWGGSGADQFVWQDDKAIKTFGTMEDFSHAEHDRINLAAILVKGGGGYHLGGSAFTDTAGEIIQFAAADGSTMVEVDTNSDGAADFTMSLVGGPVLVASDFIDAVTGTKGADALLGGPMNDIINGAEGNDTITGGQGQDTLTGGTGADTFMFRTAGSTAPGQYGHDTVTDFTHADGDRIDLSGIDGDAAAKGHQGFHLGGSTFTGSAGELIQYLSGTQTILQGDLNGDGKADFEIAFDGAPVLAAGDFIDAVTGTDQADALSGGPLNDTIMGKGGDDVITGGQGTDTLTGGGGADTFVFKTTTGSPVATPDIITDFHHGEADRIDLSGIDADTTHAHDQAFHLMTGGAFTIGDPGELIQFAQGVDTVLQGDVDGDGVADFQITLAGTHLLVAADFNI